MFTLGHACTNNTSIIVETKWWSLTIHVYNKYNQRYKWWLTCLMIRLIATFKVDIELICIYLLTLNTNKFEGWLKRHLPGTIASCDEFWFCPSDVRRGSCHRACNRSAVHRTGLVQYMEHGYRFLTHKQNWKREINKKICNKSNNLKAQNIEQPL